MDTIYDTFDYTKDAVDQVKQEVREFVFGRDNIRQIHGDDIICLQLERARHEIDGVLRSCLIIKLITVAVKYRGNGIGSQLIDFVHATNLCEVTYIDKIINDGLYDRLKNEHWKDDLNDLDRSVYKHRIRLPQ